MELKLDLSSDSLDMLFKPYEEIMLQYMWTRSIEPTGSGHLFVIVNDELAKKGKSKSRASVIFAANRFVNRGIWDYKTHTGKGGHHRRYFARMSEKELWISIKKTVNEKIDKQIRKKARGPGPCHDPGGAVFGDS